MYDSEAKAIRQAQGEGDQVFELDLDSLANYKKTNCPILGYKLVFTRKKETK